MGQSLVPSLDIWIGSANPTLRIETATLKSFPVRPRSSSKELSRAWLQELVSNASFVHVLYTKRTQYYSDPSS
jgi:hypothetical protein